MKILWISSIMPPEIAAAIGNDMPVSGGWIASSLNRLRTVPGLQTAVAVIYGGKDLVHKKINGTDYWLVPVSGTDFAKYNKGQNQYFRKIRNDFNPDIIHVHGTEYPHGLNWLEACGEKGVVVSIQGIISAIADYYRLDEKPKLLFSFRDIIQRDWIARQRLKFRRRGEIEKKILGRTKHIIGRTEWDRTHVWALNPDAEYHFVGESMRESFYNHKWHYDKCEPYSIFVAQGYYPIKGIHKMIEAMPLIIREFPETRLYVAGVDPTSKPAWRIGEYALYLKRLIRRLGLVDKVVFTGRLSEEGMLDRYLRSNLYVCCSAIENSPNSLGEAQLLGMPYLSSIAGGAAEIAGYNPDVLYRYEETTRLAKKACEIFALGNSYTPPPLDAGRYDPERNLQQLLTVYKTIAET